MYDKWFTSKSLNLGYQFHPVSFTKCELDILRFIAENGPNSIYDVKKLGYAYPYIHRNSKKLEKKGLIKSEKDPTGPRVKQILRITFKGIMVFFIAWKDGKEAKTSIKKAMTKHQHYFPFFKVWDKIINIVGEELAFKKLIKVANTTLDGSIYKVKIDEFGIEFQAFIEEEKISLRDLLKRSNSIKKKRKNPKISKLVTNNPEIKRSYIGHLASDDILDLADGYFSYNQTKKLDSESKLAELENRKLVKNKVFTPEGLKKFFPKSAALKNGFSGLLMSELLWNTLEPIETVREKNDSGVRIYPLKK